MRKQFDSSRTRVAPVFNALSELPAGWVSRLLDHVVGDSPKPRPWHSQDLTVVDRAWAPREHALQPPHTLLEWLVCNLTQSAGSTPKASAKTMEARAGLLRRDPVLIAKALEALRAGRTSRGWHVLEGASYPDVYIETRDAIIVVEGKRTEAGATTTTTWMPLRNQMIRHLDAAWDLRGNRSVYGFMVVEADSKAHSTGVPQRWLEAVESTRAGQIIDASLPHRTYEERQAIAAAFLGATTWQSIAETFGLPAAVLA